MWATAANLVLGCWLVVSSFLFRQSHFQAVSDAIGGLVAVVFAVTALSPSWESARLLNVFVAWWVWANAIFLPMASTAEAWNQGVVGYLLMTFAFIPRGGSGTIRPPATIHG